MASCYQNNLICGALADFLLQYNFDSYVKCSELQHIFYNLKNFGKYELNTYFRFLIWDPPIRRNTMEWLTKRLKQDSSLGLPLLAHKLIGTAVVVWHVMSRCLFDGILTAPPPWGSWEQVVRKDTQILKLWRNYVPLLPLMIKQQSSF